MNIKIETCRHFLEGRGVQVSTEVAAALAMMLDAQAEELARKALMQLEQENAARRMQGLPPRNRLMAEDMKRART